MLFVLFPHVFGEFFTAEDMEMDVLYALTAVLADVCDDAVSVFEPARRRNLRYCLKNRCDRSGICRIYHVGRLDMLTRNDKHVYGCLRIDVRERINFFILIDLL